MYCFGVYANKAGYIEQIYLPRLIDIDEGLNGFGYG